MKTPENLWFSGVFGEYKLGTLARNWLNTTFGTFMYCFQSYLGKYICLLVTPHCAKACSKSTIKSLVNHAWILL